MAAVGSATCTKILKLTLVEARNLVKGDIFGLSDPYVKVTVVARGGNCVVYLDGHKTHVVKKTRFPLWNESLRFGLIGNYDFSIILDVFHENMLIKDDFLGRAMIHCDLSDANPHTQPYVISDRTVWEHDQGRELTLNLFDKFSDQLFDGYLRLPHVQTISQDFAKERIKKSGRKIHHESWGRIIVKYKILDEEYIPPTPSDSSTQTADRTDTTDAVAMGFEIIDWSDHPTEATSPAPPPSSVAESNTTTAASTSEATPTESDPFVIVNSTTATVSTSAEATPSAPPLSIVAENTSTSTTSESGSQLQSRQSAEATPSDPPLAFVIINHSDVAAASTSVATDSDSDFEDLPEGWEERLDSNRRRVFINHHDRQASLHRPRVQAVSQNQEMNEQVMAEMVQTRRFLDRSTSVDLLEDGRQSSSSSSLVSEESSASDLPEGWEARLAKDGRTFYINHNTRTTTWEHPRVARENAASRVFIEDLGPLPSGWEVRKAPDGRTFFIDHNTNSTQWEDPRLLAKNKPTAKIEYSRDYKQKFTDFRSKLHPKHQIPNQLNIPVRRSDLFEDTYNFIMKVRDTETLKSRLYVEFQGEKGLDYGGVAREWFYLLSHEMFSPYYGLFEYSASDEYTLQISPESGTYNENHLDYFWFIGRICGMAVYHNRLIDAFFIRPFYKMMLKKPITLDDMQSVDVDLWHSFTYILENDPEPLCLNFSVNKTLFGEVIEEDLKPNGRNIEVTEANKKEYIDLVMKWRFTDRVKKQMDAFLRGFSDLVPLQHIKVFDERELEYLLGGLAEIDVEDWKRNTEYTGYLATDQVIVWFWKAVENYDNELRSRLLQFVTGTSKVPMNGFRELQGSQGVKKFCVKRLGEPNSLPRAHTCFNRIDLPPYPSYHKLKEMLRLAVENTEGFEGVD